MIGLKEFEDWMNGTGHQCSNQTLVKFLTNQENAGFSLIKSYDFFCQWALKIKTAYGIHDSDAPCSSLEFGRLILNANPSIFTQWIPTLPEDVKFKLMAEKFYLWAKIQKNEKLSWDTLLQNFFYGDNVLEHIQDYEGFCLLADTIRQNYGCDISNPPCMALDFYKIILTSKANYLGEKPLKIPNEIIEKIK